MGASTSESVTNGLLVAEQVSDAITSNKNRQHAHEFTLLPSDRKYTIGNDRIRGSRIWVQASVDNSTVYHLYTLDQSSQQEDIYKCFHCKRYEKSRKFCSSVKVKKSQSGETEVWELCNHYDTCSMMLAKILEGQQAIHRKPRTSATPSSTIVRRSQTPFARVVTARGSERPSPVNENTSSMERHLQLSSTSTSAVSKMVQETYSNAHGKGRTLTLVSTSSTHGNRRALTPILAASTTANQRTQTFVTPLTRNRTIAVENHAKKQLGNRSRTTAASLNDRKRKRIPMMHAVYAKRDKKTQKSTLGENISTPSLPPASSLVSLRPNTLRPPYYFMEQQYLRYQNQVGIHVQSAVEAAAVVPVSTTSQRETEILVPSTFEVPTAVLASTTLIEPLSFEPKFLQPGETFLHCIPSTSQLRQMCALLNLKYESHNQSFWHSTVLIDKVTVNSTVDRIQEVKGPRNIGFQALSTYFTNSEESFLDIQKSLKVYLAKTLCDKVVSPADFLTSSLCGFDVEKIHLYALMKIADIRIAVFSPNGIEIYGDASDGSIPSIILRKSNDENYSAVLSIA